MIIIESYEFKASLSDGIIRIPIEFREKIMNNVKNVKVVLIPDINNEATGATTVKKSKFPYFAVDTTGYAFDREEANER